jgi:hypothetical protein
MESYHSIHVRGGYYVTTHRHEDGNDRWFLITVHDKHGNILTRFFIHADDDASLDSLTPGAES